MRTVDYASGWSNRVSVAVRRAVVTGFNQVVARINEDNAEKLGTDTFEVSWHSGHRPSHWWGGLWFTREQLISVCGLGEADGLCGCNCYHSYSPIVPGDSVPTYSKEQLAQMETEENKKVEYNGKEYTKYEALQRQRKLETRMRAQRQKIKLLQMGEANEDDIIGAKVKYRTTSDEYVRFSEAMNLPQQRERVTVDGLKNIGNIKPSKTVAKSNESGIIKSSGKRIEVDDVHNIGTIDIEKYKCVTEDIKTSEVIITERQIEHIKERHPNDYERFSRFFKEIVESPDYIIEANKPNTALILKEIQTEDEKFKAVLRLVTSSDNPKYKNSIITFMKIDDKEWKRILKNKKILYKSE